MARKVTAKKAATPTLQEQFANAVEHYRNLPKGTEGAFEGKNPTAPATGLQKNVLTKMGLEGLDGMSQLDAHASMNAFKELNPEKSAEVWAETKAENAAAKAERDAAKAAEKAEKGGAEVAEAAKDGASKDGEFKRYTVARVNADKPATMHQIIQLKEAKIRAYDDPSPMPTQGEVANKMNALQTLDPKAYSKAMAFSNKTVHDWKHSEPTENQKAFAEALNIKVDTPFVPKVEGVTDQSGSTRFSVGEKIHNIKVAEPERYAAASEAFQKARAEATLAGTKALKNVKAIEAVTNPEATLAGTPALQEILKAKAEKGAEAKAASDATKLGATPALNIPEAPTAEAQADGPEA